MIEGYQIIDNFLNQEEFNNYNICFSPEISMTYNCAVADSEDNEFFLLGFLPLFVGLITAFLSSLLAIDFLLKYFSSNGLKIFIVYRVIFGVVILLNT